MIQSSFDTLLIYGQWKVLKIFSLQNLLPALIQLWKATQAIKFTSSRISSLSAMTDLVLFRVNITYSSIFWKACLYFKDCDGRKRCAIKFCLYLADWNFFPIRIWRILDTLCFWAENRKKRKESVSALHVL